MAPVGPITVIYPPFDYSRLDRAEAEFATKAAERIRGYKRAAIIDIGRELLAVKDRLDHGDFIAWVEREAGFTRRTAVSLMHVAQVLGTKWETVSHLPARLLYSLAAPSIPDDFREQVLNVDGSSGQRLDAFLLKHQLSERKRQDAAGAPRERAKKLTKGQEAYRRRQEKRDLEKRQAEEAQNLDKDREAGRLAAVIADALGGRRAEVLAGLKNTDLSRVTASLRRLLDETSLEEAGR